MVIELYFINIAQSVNHDYQALLSEIELEKAHRFRSEILKNQYICRHGILRSILGKKLHIEPKCLAIFISSKGKPYLEFNPIYFNFSYSDEMAVLAIHPEKEIGVDIEKMEKQADLLEVARQHFSKEEYQTLLKSDQQISLFYQIWTQKEAFIKAIGDGLSHSLDHFTVYTGLVNDFYHPIKGQGAVYEGWQTQVIRATEGYMVAVASHEPLLPVRLMKWEANLE